MRTAPVPDIPPIPGMNPGVIVAGGGGGGGGSGAGSGDGSSESESTNTEKGGDEAEGGAPNATSCGPGGGGGCPNPVHGNGGVKAGDPIDPVTGRVYTLAVVDMALPGAFPFVLERAYGSNHCDIDYDLGYGWNHSLGWRIIEEGRARVTVMVPTALACRGRRPDEGETVKLPAGWLTRTENGYRLQADDGIVRLFETTAAVDNHYRLTALVDRSGNRAQLAYQNGTGPLEYINDSVGRLLRVRRHGSGRIAAFEVRDESAGGAWTSFRTYEYDAQGNLVAARDALGHATAFAYDDEHRLVLERWPTGLEVHYRYDLQGRCVETWCTDPREPDLVAANVPDVLADGKRAKGFLHVRIESVGKEVDVVTSRSLRRVAGNAFGKADRVVFAGSVHQNEFDASGDLVGYRDGLDRAWSRRRDSGSYRVVNPLGHSEDYEYDERGSVITARQPDGLATQHGRDARGNLVDLSDALGFVANFSYDPRGNLVSAETADGGRTTMAYDALCNRVEIVEPDGSTRKLEYDFLGRLVAMKDAGGGLHRWLYDAMGRMIEYVSPLGARTLDTYDDMGRFSGQRQPDGRWYRLVYAGLREVIAVERNDGSRVAYAYDRELDLVRIVNEDGDVHSIERDLEGRIIAERTFDGRRLEYKNDRAGRLAKLRYEDGSFVEFEYDALDRLIKRTFSDDTSQSLEYDPCGRLILFETEAVRTRYDYDARGRCVREESELLGHPASKTSIESLYDAGVRRTGMTLLGGWSLASPRDATGRCIALQLSDARGPDQPLASFAYDSLGGEALRRFGGAGGLAQERDAHGSVTSASVFGGGGVVRAHGEPVWIGPQPDSVTLRFDYRWSPAGDLEMFADRDRGAQAFAYDARGRIAERRVEGRAEGESYQHSPRGDVVRIVDRAQSFLEGGRLARTNSATLEYDALGRVTKKVEGANVTAFEWNAAGLLARMTLLDRTVLEFVYDGFARRLEKRVLRGAMVERHRYVWDGDDLLEQTVERRLAAGTPFAFLARRRYVYAPQSRVPVAQAIDTAAGPGAWKYFVHRDGAAAPLALVDARGAIDELFELEAYGRMVGGNEVATLSRFAGHWYDPESGLHFNRWRYYDPATATYLSPEPIGYLGGLESYAYVHGRPLVLVDPDGLAATTLTGVNGTINRADGKPITGISTREGAVLHPAVAAALPNASARGGATLPESCGEPAALSEFLKKWEHDNPGMSCDPGTLEGRTNLNKALSNVKGISTKDGAKDLAACPNCSQTISRVFALAHPSLVGPNVAGGQVSTRDKTQVPGGLQNPEGSRTIHPAGVGPVVLPPSPLASKINDPAMKAANEEKYRQAGGTGSVTGLNPGVFDNSSGTWKARP